MQPSLKVVPHNKVKTLLDCATQLISKAYEMEFVVDACMGKEVCHCYLARWLLDIIEEISHIKVEVENIP